MIALAAALLMQVTPPGPFDDIPITSPCLNGQRECYPWDRDWRGNPPRDIYGELGTASNGEVWGADIASIVNGRGNSEPRVWTEVDYRAVRSERARRARILFQIQCGSRRIAVLHSVRYSASGDVLSSWDVSPFYPRFQYVVPGSMHSMLADQVCRPR